MQKYYRLHAKHDHTQEMALAYDIQCPKCSGRLKQIGRQLSFNELGLYTCLTCNRYQEEIIMGYFTDVTASPEYDIQFWNAARGKRGSEDVLAKGRISTTGSYQLPASTAGDIEKAMTKQSVFRNIATVIKAYKSGYRIVAKDCNDVAEFIPELGEIPVQDGMKDFNETSIESHKLAVFVKLEEDFVRDAVFSLERYLIGRFAKNFGKAEENAFINGTGVDEPTGILHESNGAEVGVTTETLTYDDVISLYFSVESSTEKMLFG